MCAPAADTTAREWAFIPNRACGHACYSRGKGLHRWRLRMCSRASREGTRDPRWPRGLKPAYQPHCAGISCGTLACFPARAACQQPARPPGYLALAGDAGLKGGAELCVLRACKFASFTRLALCIRSWRRHQLHKCPRGADLHWLAAALVNPVLTECPPAPHPVHILGVSNPYHGTGRGTSTHLPLGPQLAWRAFTVRHRCGCHFHKLAGVTVCRSLAPRLPWVLSKASSRAETALRGVCGIGELSCSAGLANGEVSCERAAGPPVAYPNATQHPITHPAHARPRT